MGLADDCSALSAAESGDCIRERTVNMDISNVIVVFLAEKVASTMPYIREKSYLCCRF